MVAVSYTHLDVYKRQEFNWPQHHRPSTYMPVDTTIEENADGSVTVWVNEMEQMCIRDSL